MQKENKFLDRLRLIHLAKNNINTMIGLIVSTTLLLVIFIEQVPRTLLLSYFFITIFQALGRIYFFKRFLKAVHLASELDTNRFEITFAALASLSAITYSTFSILFFPYISQMHQLFLVVIATGMVGITFNSNAASSKIFIPYAILTMGPFCIWYGMQNSNPESFISLFIVIFCIMFVNSSHSVNKYIISFLEAKQDNEHLLMNLKKRKKDLEETNINLKNHIEKNESLKEKLVQQESLAGLGVLTSGLAHEIKNPLNFIINSSLILEEIIKEFSNNKDDLKKGTTIDLEESLADAHTSIKLISNEGKKANDIVTHLLSTYSHQKDSYRSTFKLNKLIESVAKTTQLALKGKISGLKGVVEIELDIKIKDYNGHESELNKVLFSIIYNSFEAIEEKYNFDPENFKPLVKVESKVIEENILIIIYDNGIGVKENHLNKVFTPFFTTKPTNKATGLGMSSSYEIIKNLFQGDIKLNSQQGQFTRVEIILPLKPKD